MVVCRKNWKRESPSEARNDVRAVAPSPAPRREAGPIFLTRRAPSAHALALLAETGASRLGAAPAPAAPPLRLVS